MVDGEQLRLDSAFGVCLLVVDLGVFGSLRGIYTSMAMRVILLLSVRLPTRMLTKSIPIASKEKSACFIVL